MTTRSRGRVNPQKKDEVVKDIAVLRVWKKEKTCW